MQFSTIFTAAILAAAVNALPAPVESGADATLEKRQCCDTAEYFECVLDFELDPSCFEVPDCPELGNCREYLPPKEGHGCLIS
jgi:hypothetical protein